MRIRALCGRRRRDWSAVLFALAWLTRCASASQRYGSAYLATSITLSLISFSLFYALIAYGVDVSVLLGKVLRCLSSSTSFFPLTKCNPRRLA